MLIPCILPLAASKFASHPLLLSRARMVMNVGEWKESQITVGKYLWWSPTAILAFTKDDTFRRIDTDTRSNVPFPLPAFKKERGELSPDRSLMVAQDWKGQTITWTVSDPSGGKKIGSWSIQSRVSQPSLDEDRGYPPPEALWSEDGRSLYQIEYWRENDRILTKVTKRSLRELRKGTPFPKVVSKPWAPYLQIHNDRALLTTYQPPDARRMSVWMWDLTHPTSTIRKWTIRASKGQVIVAYLPSPDYKRVVWVMGTPGPTQLTDHGYPYRSISLWTSGLHGEGMKEIGEIPFPSRGVDAQMDHYQHFGEMQWNPDSKRVSFIYYRKLYVVQAGA